MSVFGFSLSSLPLVVTEDMTMDKLEIEIERNKKLLLYLEECCDDVVEEASYLTGCNAFPLLVAWRRNRNCRKYFWRMKGSDPGRTRYRLADKRLESVLEGVDRELINIGIDIEDKFLVLNYNMQVQGAIVQVLEETYDERNRLKERLLF